MPALMIVMIVKKKNYNDDVMSFVFISSDKAITVKLKEDKK